MTTRLKYLIYAGFIVLLVVLIWWMFFYDPYRPKAYVGISEYDLAHDGRTRINYRSYIVEIDLPTATVSDTFPISDTVPQVRDIEVDQNTGELYVGGQVPGSPVESSKSKGVDVYDLDSKQRIRTLDISGPRSARNIRTSRNSEKILMNNPYRNEQEGEKGKRSGVYDIESGEFLHGFDHSARPYHFISEQGHKLYHIFGLHESASIGVHSTVQNERILHILQDKEQMLERGGMHPDPEESFELEYPYYVWSHHWKPMEVYERTTMERIDTGPVVMEGLDKSEVTSNYSTTATMLSKDHRYLVVRFTKGTGTTADDPEQLFIRVVDLEKMEIVGTTKVWEGVLTRVEEGAYGDYTEVVVH